jgi:hypothetical protein
MSDQVLLQLWSGHRDKVLAELKFYRDQAEKRVLNQFSDIEAEAEDFSHQEYERMGQYFDPDRHDPSDFAEAAWEKGIDHFMLLQDLQKQMLVGLIAGMYHEFEKQLREWLQREFAHSFRMEKLEPRIWSQDIGKIFDLLESCGWKIRNKRFFGIIDSCRLIVNVFKHGNGKSLDDLKASYPQFLRTTFSGDDLPTFPEKAEHSDLEVTADDFDKFYQGFRQFWEFVPKETMFSEGNEVPTWFASALKS